MSKEDKHNLTTHHHTSKLTSYIDVTKDFKGVHDNGKAYNMEELNRFLMAYTDSTFSKEKSVAYVLTNYMRKKAIGDEDLGSRFQELEKEFQELRKNYMKCIDSYINAFNNWSDNWEKRIKKDDENIEVYLDTNSVMDKTNLNDSTNLFSATNTEQYSSVLERYKVNQDVLRKEKELGKGGFGVVYTASYVEDGRTRWTVAVKEILPTTDKFKVNFDLAKECQILKELQNENVVEFYGVIKLDSGAVKLVMEFCSKGSMQSILFSEHSEKVPISRKLFMAKEVLSALRFVHDKKYLHLDLKPSNILVNQYYNCKLADFGMSQHLAANTHQPVGTNIYMAPEVYKFEGVTAGADVYSFGLVIYALFLGIQPFEKIWKRSPEPSTEQFWIEKLRDEVTFPNSCSLALKNLVRTLTRSTASERPSISEIEDNGYLDKLLNGAEKFRSIWEKNFKDRESVHLIEFILYFYKEYNIKPPQIMNIKKETVYKVFKAVMTRGNNMLINKTNVDNFILLMTPVSDDPKEIIGKAKSLLSEECFWGVLAQEDAETILGNSKHHKTYIVRFSVGEQGKYTFSWTTDKGKKREKIVHRRVEYKDLQKWKDIIEKKGFSCSINTKKLPIASCHSIFVEKYETGPESKGDLLPPEYQYVHTAFDHYSATVVEESKNDPEKYISMDGV